MPVISQNPSGETISIVCASLSDLIIDHDVEPRANAIAELPRLDTPGVACQSEARPAPNLSSLSTVMLPATSDLRVSSASGTPPCTGLGRDSNDRTRTPDAPSIWEFDHCNTRAWLDDYASAAPPAVVNTEGELGEDLFSGDTLPGVTVPVLSQYTASQGSGSVASFVYSSAQSDKLYYNYQLSALPA